jgi:hypothetical protein
MFENNIKNQIQMQTSPPTSTDYLAVAKWVCGILPTARQATQRLSGHATIGHNAALIQPMSACCSTHISSS